MPAHSRSKNGVASLADVAGIHVLAAHSGSKTWMAGTSPAMTNGPCASQGFRRTIPRSLALDVVALDHRRPARDLGVHESPEFRRRRADQLHPDRRQPVAD